MSKNPFEHYLTDSIYKTNQIYNVKLPIIGNDAECDVCIIGGGLTGISTALHLINSGKRVILIEAGTIAEKASGVNGGQVSNSYGCGMEFFENKFGLEIAQKFWKMSLDGLNIVKSNIAKYNINCNWQSGIGHVAYKPHHFKKLEHEYNILRNKFSYPDIHLYNAIDTQKILATNKYHGLLYDSSCGHINPQSYTLALMQILESASNIKAYENSRATSIEFSSNNKHIIIVNNKIRITAKHVILACNIGNYKFLPELKSNILTLDTFIMATESLSNTLANSLINNKMAVYDTRNSMNYFRLTENNNLLFGGGDAFGKFNIKDVQQTLYKELLYIYPQLSEIKIQNFWSGQESITLNLAPNIGTKFDKTVYYAQGYSGQGLALSNLIGKIFTDAINGDTSKLDLFAQIKPWRLTNSRLIQDLTMRLGIYYYKFIDKIL